MEPFLPRLPQQYGKELEADFLLRWPSQPWTTLLEAARSAWRHLIAVPGVAPSGPGLPRTILPKPTTCPSPPPLPIPVITVKTKMTSLIKFLKSLPLTSSVTIYHFPCSGCSSHTGLIPVPTTLLEHYGPGIDTCCFLWLGHSSPVIIMANPSFPYSFSFKTFNM